MSLERVLDEAEARQLPALIDDWRAGHRRTRAGSRAPCASIVSAAQGASGARDPGAPPARAPRGPVPPSRSRPHCRRCRRRSRHGRPRGPSRRQTLVARGASAARAAQAGVIEEYRTSVEGALVSARPVKLDGGHGAHHRPADRDGGAPRRQQRLGVVRAAVRAC